MLPALDPGDDRVADARALRELALREPECLAPAGDELRDPGAEVGRRGSSPASAAFRTGKGVGVAVLAGRRDPFVAGGSGAARGLLRRRP